MSTLSEKKAIQIHFAPLQGYTDSYYRNAHEAAFGGIDAYYTPFVRLEKGHTFRSRDLRDISSEHNHVGKLIPQIIASTPDEMKELADVLIKNGHTSADLNLGCPFPMIARRHKGAGLLPYADEVEALLKTIQDISQLRFSLKMRLGWHSSNEILSLAHMLNDAPLSHICLHARNGEQQYKGTTDLEGFSQFYHICRVPLLFNGDIRTTQDINTIMTQFPNLEGVMIGRGLLSNPALALEYKNGKTLEMNDKKNRMRQLHHDIYSAYRDYLQGDRQVLDKIKPFWDYLTDELEKRTRKKIEKASKIDAYENAVVTAFSQWGKVEHYSDNKE